MHPVIRRKRNSKLNNIFQLFLVLVVLLLVNIIAEFVFTRIDLTEERRYTLSPATKKMLKNLNDDIFFRVYLDGDLPPGFRRLSNETREMLDEFRAYSNHIHYEFIDPSANPNDTERTNTYRLLAEQGLQPTDLRVNQKGQASQLIIFPGAIVAYQERETPVQLLQTQLGQGSEQVLNSSIQGLEYNLANAIEKLTQTIKPRIAFLEGQGELSRAETIDIEAALSEYYIVERVELNQKINSLTVRLKTDSSGDPLVNKYRALIIAKPSKPFDEKDKFLIDQFIMRGGKVLWLIDPVFASMDSLEKYTSTLGIANPVNLEDMLFTYGVRLNANLVMDVNALPIPIKTGQIGNQPQFDFFRWYFFPLLTPATNHPVVNGLNAIKTEFISSIDTIETPEISKTFLLTTSPYSRTVNVPALIELEILRDKPDMRLFDQGAQTTGILLEGIFPSAYLFRIPPEIATDQGLGFRDSSKPTRMIVITDGDIIKNQFHFSQGYPLPLGYDQYTRETFGNKELMLNSMNYLCDDSGLISIRSRQLKLRLLDGSKLENKRIWWQMINLVVPALIVILVGFVKYRFRRFKFTRANRSREKHKLT